MIDGKKKNFRKALKRFCSINWILICNMKRLVINSEKKQEGIIFDIHYGLGDDLHGKACEEQKCGDNS